MSEAYRSEIINKFIIAYEKMRDSIHFSVKTPIDDLVCPICGGRYKRRDKSKHSKRKKHKLMLPLVLGGKVFPTLDWEETNQEIEESNEEEN